MGQYRLAVDTGGTFSDFVLYDEESGQIHVTKVPSTPEDPDQAVLQGVEELCTALGASAEEFTGFVHGTTVATNALLEGKGARAGLLVTEGFRGVYEVREQTRAYGTELFDLLFEKPPMLVPQSRTFEIRERIGASGQVDVALDMDSVARAIDGLERAGVEAVAVCLLFSFANPDHEDQVVRALKARHPEWFVTASSRLVPQIREYYRLSTTVVNAFLAPRMSSYLARLQGAVRDRGLASKQQYVMQSNGGTASFGAAGSNAVTTILSGPAGGVIGALDVAVRAGNERFVSFDMGGTSCDVSLCEGDTPQRTHLSAIEGHHIAVPSLDIHTVSAGGGTQAWVDDLGRLHVGPHSAGSVPGPVCYGRGGVIPTVTDCDLLLGYLNPAQFLGGRMTLDVDAARAAVAERIADKLGVDPLRAASGVVQVVNVKMAEAIKAISTHRGFDLREFSLVAFGGAGPMHAAQIALDLGIDAVIIPPYAGVNSALGCLASSVLHDFAISRLEPIERVSNEDVIKVFDQLTNEATAQLEAEGFAAGERRLVPSVDLRYAGQGYELNVPLHEQPHQQPHGANGSVDPEALRRRFDDVHKRRHGHSAPTMPVEVVTYRLTAVGEVPRPAVETLQAASEPVERARVGSREVFFFDSVEKVADCPVFARDRLRAGHVIQGPAIVEQFDSTVVIMPGQHSDVDAHGNLVLRRTDRP